MAKAKTTPELVLTPEEIQAVIDARARVEAKGSEGPSVAVSDLATALITAINATKPPEKKTPFNRKRTIPLPTVRPKRTYFQHGIEVDCNLLTNEDIELLNKLRPGSYFGGHVKVIKRKDGGIDVDYPIRTAAQRLKLVNNWGVTSFTVLLQKLIAEADVRRERAKQGIFEEDDEL